MWLLSAASTRYLSADNTAALLRICPDGGGARYPSGTPFGGPYMFRNPTTDLIVVLVIVLLIFGPKRLPGLGKSLGSGMREFKDSITGKDDSDDTERPEIARTSAPPVAEATEASRTAEPAPARPKPADHSS
jgi:sec-independent protein translocase protein TatA